MRRWPLLLLALPAAVSTWSGWVGLGRMVGFGVVTPLPGIVDGFTIDTAITLPIGVEAYAAYALNAWLSAREISAGTRSFAKWSAVGSLLLGMLGQVAYHLLAVHGYTVAPWQVVVAVSCLPVLVLGMGAALGHLLARDAQVTESTPVADLRQAAPVVVEVLDETLVEAVPEPPQVHPAPVPEPSGTPPQDAAPRAVEVPDERLVEATPAPDAKEMVADLRPLPLPVDDAPVPVEVHPAPAPAPSGTPLPVDVEAEGQALGDAPPAPAAPQVEGVPVAAAAVPEPSDLHHAAASKFFFEIAAGQVPGVRRIKEELGVGQDKAQAVRAYLTALAAA